MESKNPSIDGRMDDLADQVRELQVRLVELTRRVDSLSTPPVVPRAQPISGRLEQGEGSEVSIKRMHHPVPETGQWRRRPVQENTSIMACRETAQR